METKQVKAYGKESITQPLHEMVINRRAIQAHDIEFEVLYCGICHSDLHQIKNDFGGTMWPDIRGLAYFRK